MSRSLERIGLQRLHNALKHLLGQAPGIPVPCTAFQLPGWIPFKNGCTSSGVISGLASTVLMKWWSIGTQTDVRSF